MKIFCNVAINVVSEEIGNTDIESFKRDLVNFQREMQEQYLRGMLYEGIMLSLYDGWQIR